MGGALRMAKPAKSAGGSIQFPPGQSIPGIRTITIWGNSDDLVEIEGTVPGCDEYGHYGEGPAYVELSTGTVFSIEYTSGAWSVNLREVPIEGESVQAMIIAAATEDDYTDRAVITGPIEWVRFWIAWPPSPKEKAEVASAWQAKLGDELPDQVGAELYDVLWRAHLEGVL